MIQAMELMQEQGLTVEEVDVLTGSAIGWPRTGSFRLADMVGIDILAHVVSNFAQSRAGEALAAAVFRADHARSPLAGRQNRPGLLQKGKRRGRQRAPARPRLANRRLPSGDTPQVSFARTGEECRIAARAAAPAHGRRCSQRQGGRLPMAACSIAFLPTPPTACQRSPRSRPASTAPCAPASTGNSAPLKCGMRWA